MNKLLLAGFLSVMSFTTFASTGTSSQMGQGQQGGQPPHNAQIEQALKECADSVAKDSSGKPDRTAFDSCMSAKGFQKPQGPRPGSGGQGQGQPPAMSGASS